jgi:phosphotransacetylase
MPLPSFSTLFSRADQARPGLGVAAAGAADPTVLAALGEASARGWVRPILCASEKALTPQGPLPTGVRVVDTADPARAAVEEVRAKRASLLMKGQISTPDLMKAVLARENGLRTSRVVCQAVLLEVVAHGRTLLLADTGITPRPTVEQKLDIIESLVDLSRRLGEPRPRIALVSASEKVTDALPDTLEGAEVARRCTDRGMLAQGPLSFDLAYAAEASQRKGVGGAAVGAADILVFPDLTSANLTVKAMMYTADCRFGGMLLGAACPVVFLSRADSARDRMHSLALALAAADAPSDS